MAIAALVGANACSDDSSSTVTDAVEPPTLSIASVRPAGAPIWTAETPCAEIPRDVAGTVVIQVTTTDLDVRPPGVCGSRAQCGQLRLGYELAGEPVEIISSSRGISAELLDQFMVGESYTFRVTAVTDDGTRILNAEGEPLSDEVTIELEAEGACGGVIILDAGSDADPGDAGEDGGATDAGDSDAGDAGDDDAGDIDAGDDDAGDIDAGDDDAGDLDAGDDDAGDDDAGDDDAGDDDAGDDDAGDDDAGDLDAGDPDAGDASDPDASDPDAGDAQSD